VYLDAQRIAEHWPLCRTSQKKIIDKQGEVMWLKFNKNIIYKKFLTGSIKL
jgi:hypothetical protein